ncbi:MAG: DUF47 domain-containing protein [Candidatus Hodarchaeales archaeon]|jgi:predicted phosphate transport protein (TIGR00153 family)
MNDKRSPPKPKRKYLAKEFSELADIVSECAKSLKKTCEALQTPDKLQEAIKSVYDAETKGDVVRDRLLRSFATERHPPIIQMDRIELMHRLDKITNKTEHAARQIELAGGLFPPQEIEGLIEIAEIVYKTTKCVTKAVQAVFHSFEEAMEKVEDVEDLRDLSRDKTFALQAKVLKNSETDFKTLFAVEQITQRVQQVAERSKQAADLIENMKLKYL